MLEYENNKLHTKNKFCRKSNFKIQSVKKQGFCFYSNLNFDGVCKMNMYNILFRHATKNFEISISVSISKFKLENTITKLEIAKN